mmetsp:Transcript_3679/g.15269  ORF Transcript_3679/g.15269 Transcript_3679/m.15269 type:complete len:422 (-) Transcript_3679:1652-2917(-)
MGTGSGEADGEGGAAASLAASAAASAAASSGVPGPASCSVAAPALKLGAKAAATAVGMPERAVMASREISIGPPPSHQRRSVSRPSVLQPSSVGEGTNAGSGSGAWPEAALPAEDWRRAASDGGAPVTEALPGPRGSAAPWPAAAEPIPRTLPPSAHLPLEGTAAGAWAATRLMSHAWSGVPPSSDVQRGHITHRPAPLPSRKAPRTAASATAPEAEVECASDAIRLTTARCWGELAERAAAGPASSASTCSSASSRASSSGSGPDAPGAASPLARAASPALTVAAVSWPPASATLASQSSSCASSSRRSREAAASAPRADVAAAAGVSPRARRRRMTASTARQTALGSVLLTVPARAAARDARRLRWVTSLASWRVRAATMGPGERSMPERSKWCGRGEESSSTGCENSRRAAVDERAGG